MHCTPDPRPPATAPARRRLLVLANSAKHAERCVAGREVIDGPGGYRLGAWVRPVSPHGRGELWAAEHAYPGGRSVAVFDFADVRLDGPAAEPGQPENWALYTPVGWADVTHRYRRPPADGLAETPADLWLQPGQPTDRVTHDYLVRHPPDRSLVVIRPDDARLAFWSEDRGGRVKRKRQCLFRYAGTSYALPLTDPVLTKRYEHDIPPPDEPSFEVPLTGDRLLVCVSLAGCFRGRHYKVVATVFEEPLWQHRGTLASIRSAIRTTLWKPSCYSSAPTV